MKRKKQRIKEKILILLGPLPDLYYLWHIFLLSVFGLVFTGLVTLNKGKKARGGRQLVEQE